MFILISNSLLGVSLARAQNYPSEDQWMGIGSDWRVLNKPTTLSINEVLNLWENDIEEKMQNWNFNTVRLAFAFPDSETTTRNVINYEELDEVLNLLDSYGLKAILDLHNYEDMQGYFGSDEWINSWVELANNYKDDDRIVAFEIFNEPFGQDKPSRISTWDSSISGGGTNISDGTEGVASALADCVDAIRSTGDNHTIVYPDPWWFRPTKDEVFNPQSFLESGYSRENIVVTMHPWFLWDDQSIATMYDEFFFKQREKFEAWAEYYSIWIGEFGAASPDEKSWSIQKTLCVEIVNYAISKGIGFNFWISRDTLAKRGETWTLIEEILASSTYPNLKLQNELEQLTQNYDDLLKDYNELLKDYNVTLAENNLLLQNYTKKVEEYNEIFDKLNQKIQHYNIVLNELEQQTNDNDDLLKDYNELLKDNNVTLVENNLLLQNYTKKVEEHNEISNELEHQILGYSALQSLYNQMVTENAFLFYASVAIGLVCVVISVLLFIRLRRQNCGLTGKKREQKT